MSLITPSPAHSQGSSGSSWEMTTPWPWSQPRRQAVWEVAPGEDHGEEEGHVVQEEAPEEGL